MLANNKSKNEKPIKKKKKEKSTDIVKDKKAI